MSRKQRLILVGLIYGAISLAMTLTGAGQVISIGDRAAAVGMDTLIYSTIAQQSSIEPTPIIPLSRAYTPEEINSATAAFDERAARIRSDLDLTDWPCYWFGYSAHCLQ